MSDRLPYEEQLPHQWDALPLPDENLAWADMKRRLEEDDRKPLAWWSRGCMLWGFLLLALLGAGWWLLRPDKWFDKKKEAKSVVQVKSDKGTIPRITTTDTITMGQAKKEVDQTPGEITKPRKRIDSIVVRTGNNTKTVDIKNPADKDNKIKAVKTNGKKNRNKTSGLIPVKNTYPVASNPKDDNDEKKDNKDKPGKKEVTEPVVPDLVTVKKNDSVVVKDKKPVQQDTLVTAGKKDTVKRGITKTDSAVVTTTASKDTVKKRPPLYFSAGIALHQQLPVAGQKLTPYNSLGRKGSLGDYIPSVYFRLNKKDKWFLQAEFRYGAPQYNKDFVYDQQLVADTGSNPVFTTITSTQLKKTFYHQLPLTFNYYITKNWAVGAGIQWNSFSSAISEEEVNKRRNANLQDSIVSKLIRVDKGDTASRFTKNYFLGVVESEFRWKRFALGARYTFGLQPYIRFTLPGGAAQQQKSTSLQLFLRYQLWRSKNR